MALPRMKIVHRCLDGHGHPPAERFNIKLMGHGIMSSRALFWNPFTDQTLPKIHGRRVSPFTFASSLHEGTLPSSTSPPPNNNNDFLQSAFSSPTPATKSTRPLSAVQHAEEVIEKIIFNCRFLTLMGVVGSLTGSVLCFFKGCTFVVESFREYLFTCLKGMGSGKVVLLLVEAVDVYLMGTVMLIFGMGLYELFISTLDVPGVSGGSRTNVCGSNLFGLFRLTERPKWLEIRSLDELKTKLGHVIVMILLVGMFEKSKKERPKWLEIRSLDELKTKLGHVIVMILLVGMFEKSKKVPVHSGLDLFVLFSIHFILIRMLVLVIKAAFLLKYTAALS